MTEICGHRGARFEKHENTIASFNRALEIGADMVELDVRFTSDKKAVIHHDSDINGLSISKISLEEAKHAANLSGFKLATLDDVLSFARGKIKLDIEVKEAGMEEYLVSSVSARLDIKNYIISSFNDKIISKIKTLNPEIKTALLLGGCHPRQYGHGYSEAVFFIKRARLSHADIVLFQTWLLPFGVIARAHKSGFKTGVWTVNSTCLIRRLLKDSRVDFIITDFPEKAVNIGKENKVS